MECYIIHAIHAIHCFPCVLRTNLKVLVFWRGGPYRFSVLFHLEPFQPILTTIGRWVFWPWLIFSTEAFGDKVSVPWHANPAVSFNPSEKSISQLLNLTPKHRDHGMKHNLYLQKNPRRKRQEKRKTLGVTTNRAVTKNLAMELWRLQSLNLVDSSRWNRFPLSEIWSIRHEIPGLSGFPD